MTKRDINFIKHIRPQIKERERRDKEVSRSIQSEKAMRSIGLDTRAGIDLDALSFAFSLMKRANLKIEESTVVT